MALRVDDAEHALIRARALLCSEWNERVGPGERRIPAVRAPDGTLIYLVAPDPAGRSIYDDDFRMFEDVAAGDSPVSEIDHVAQAVPFGRMDAFVLFWRAVFGLEPQGVFELPDPYGLVRSRAMVSHDRTLRLPLNSSEVAADIDGAVFDDVLGRRGAPYRVGDVRHHRGGRADDGAGCEAAAEFRRIIMTTWRRGSGWNQRCWRRCSGINCCTIGTARASSSRFIRRVSTTGSSLNWWSDGAGTSRYGAANAAIRLAAQAQRHPLGGDYR